MLTEKCFPPNFEYFRFKISRSLELLKFTLDILIFYEIHFLSNVISVIFRGIFSFFFVILFIFLILHRYYELLKYKDEFL